MDAIINTLGQLNLNNVGRPHADANRKRQILDAIRAIPQGFQLAAIDGIVADEIEDFNQEIINIEREITDFFSQYGQHASLNCGPRLVNYTNIRRIAHELDQRIDNQTNYAIILRFILKPVVSLPEDNDISNFDNERGEKTFSKMCLNLAVKLSLDKLNFVNGYWLKRQLVDFPEE